MGYSLKASSIRGAVDKIAESKTNITNIEFPGVWKGPAFNSQTDDLNTLLGKVESEISKYESYASALDNLQTYKNNCERLTSLYSELNSLSDDEEDDSRRNSINYEISVLTNANEQLRPILMSNMTAIAESTIGSELSLVSYDITPLPAEYHDYPLMFQTDYDDIPFSQGTVATSGCGISCAAMVISYYTGEEVTPGYLGENFNIPGASNATRMTSALDEYEIEWANNWDAGYDFYECKELIEQGHPVIALMNENSIFTNYGHFILITGITEDGKYIVHDPNGENYNNSSLLEGYENGFTDSQIINGWSGCWIMETKEEYLSGDEENN